MVIHGLDTEERHNLNDGNALALDEATAPERKAHLVRYRVVVTRTAVGDKCIG